MPWKEVNTMDARVRFVMRLLDGERMIDLCRENDISRKTGYKFLERYEKFGFEGLQDQSRKPFRLARQTDDEVTKLIVRLKGLYPTWGPKKLRVKLEQRHPGISFPAVSTIGEILERRGLVKKRRHRSIEERLFPSIVSDGSECNQIWNNDFKGQFKLGDGSYCYPLTVTDDSSRFILGIESLISTKCNPTIAAYEALFDEYGVPDAMRSDNGVPFSARGFGGLSALSAWWMSLGIKPMRTKPASPQENGKHERMHRTLKAETTKPSGKNQLNQQEKFNHFRKVYNDERPHEALGMKVPSNLYHKSKIKYSDAQRKDHYKMHDFTRMVTQAGTIRTVNNHWCFLGRALTGHKLGIREIGQGIMLASLGPFDIGFIDCTSPKHVFKTENPLKGSTDEWEESCTQDS